jgi:hypothetical protein
VAQPPSTTPPPDLFYLCWRAGLHGDAAGQLGRPPMLHKARQVDGWLNVVLSAVLPEAGHSPAQIPLGAAPRLAGQPARGD